MLPLTLAAHPHHDEATEPATGWWPEDYRPEPAPPWLRTLLPQPPERGASLRDAAASAEHLLLATATAREERDDGRLRLTTLRIEHDYRGSLRRDTAMLAEVTGALRHAPLPMNRPLLLLLDRAPDHSYLRGHGDDLLVRSDPALSAFVLHDSTQADAAARWLDAPAGERRAAVLELLATGHAPLSRHALAELRENDDDTALSDTERAAIARVMQHRLPGKAGLADWLAQRQAPAALIEDAPGDPPELQARLWHARNRLGQAPPEQAAMQWRHHDDDAHRAAAAWLLALHGSGRARHALQHLLAEDPSPAVRRAGIEALAFLPSEHAAALLPAAFDSAYPDLRAAAGRLILVQPGDAPERLLEALVRSARVETARVHAAMLLVHRAGTDDARVQELARATDTPEARRVLRHGIVREDVLHLHGEGHGHGMPAASGPHHGH